MYCDSVTTVSTSIGSRETNHKSWLRPRLANSCVSEKPLTSVSYYYYYYHHILSHIALDYTPAIQCVAMCICIY